LTFREGLGLKVQGAEENIWTEEGSDITGGWRKLHNEELRSYSSPNIILMIKSRWMRLVGHVASIEETRNAYRLLMGNQKEDATRKT
jgi:hypothetical protein